MTGLQEAHAVAALVPETEIITVAESESDIYEWLVAGQAAADETHEGEAAPRRAQWIVRACQDRALRPQTGADRDAATHLSEAVEAGAVLTTDAVSVRGREPESQL